MSELTRAVILPASFTDPDRQSEALEREVRKRIGEDWTLTGVDMDERKAYFARSASVAQVAEEGATRRITLPATVRPNEGEKWASTLEQMYPGWTMIEFDPFVRYARLARMSEEETRAREALAYALGVKPWQVSVKAVAGGFDVVLPASYASSRHDKRIEEVVTGVIGRPGWFWRVDAAELTMTVREGTLPTFAPVIPYPLDRPVPRFALHSRDWAWLPLGRALPEPGETVGTEVGIDVLRAVHTQLGGLSGAGKSVDLNCLIASWLARGGQLVIVDLPSKAVDFLWARAWTMERMGWGCASLDAAAAVLGMVLEEGERRARVLAEHGVVKWTDLPPECEEDFRPIMVVADEVTGLFMAEEEPKALPKDHPIRIEAQEVNLKKALIKRAVKKIAAELRFVGIGLVLASQVASATTGIGPDLRTNLQNKVLKGVSPTKDQKAMVFTDPDALPAIPAWVATDPARGRGVGLIHPEGRAPKVFKGYYASVEDLSAFVRAHGAPEAAHPEPAAADIARLVPSLAGADEDDAAYAPASTEGWGQVEADSELKGAARAAHELAVSAAALRRKRAQAE